MWLLHACTHNDLDMFIRRGGARPRATRATARGAGKVPSLPVLEKKVAQGTGQVRPQVTKSWNTGTVVSPPISPQPRATPVDETPHVICKGSNFAASSLHDDTPHAGRPPRRPCLPAYLAATAPPLAFITVASPAPPPQDIARCGAALLDFWHHAIEFFFLTWHFSPIRHGECYIILVH
jgi:hypothetical protein